jgi:ClpX C4-type zinc finger
MSTLSKLARRAVVLFTSPLRTPIRCGGCGREKNGVRRMVSGPRVYFCDSCVEQAAQQLTPRRPASDAVRCRFCFQFRARTDVTSVGNVAVCADCLGYMEAILAEAKTSPRDT